MAPISWYRRTWTPVLLLLGLIVCGGVAYLIYRYATGQVNGGSLPVPGMPVYDRYVRDFELGVARLDSNMPPEAIASLTQAIEAIPQEPAAWADRGLVRLRNNELPAAVQDLQQAQQRAPANARIEALLGLLARKQGQFDDAVGHLRKAVDLNPDDSVTRYALTQVIAQQGGPDSEAEYQKQLEILLQARPTNIFLLVELASTAARRGDAAAFQRALAGLQKLAPGWGEQQRAMLQKVQKAAQTGGINVRLVPDINILGNVVKEEPDYARGKTAIDPPLNVEGQPLRHFLKLQSPPPSPSPPDLDMTWVASPLAGALSKGHWDRITPLWLTGEGPPIVLVVNGHEVRSADKGNIALSFPGGAAAAPPTLAGVLPVDWNNDFHTDILCAGGGGLRFWQQNAQGSFTDVTAKTHLPDPVLKADYFGAWAADIDLDGDLDLIVAPRSGPVQVLRNNNDGTFKLLHTFGDVADVRAFVWADLDNDGASDAVLLDARGRVHVFMNERSGQFRSRPVPDALGKCLAVAVGDVNHDGVFDLILLRDDGTLLRLSDEGKRKSWTMGELARWSEVGTGLGPGSVYLHVADLDNNGSPDLVAAGPQGGQVWLSGPEEKFTALATALPPRVQGIVDVNDNGRLDLVSLDKGGRPVTLLNHGTKDYHWQTLRLRANYTARPDQRINSFGLGGYAEIRAGMLVSSDLITTPRVHFGLGDHARADFVSIVWPNGVGQVEFDDIAPDRTTAKVQRVTTSCPFLFTYDGHRMRFIKDFMWSTPLGMYINAQNPGGFVQTTEWIKIDGDKLAPRNGYYDVRVTAELWETHFDDLLALIAVDHPAGTEMFVDEAFPMVARPLKLHLTGLTHPVARASDERGRDVTDVVRNVDGRYLDTFGLGTYQGVARDHWIEVELGDSAPRTGPLWLVATGWLHPTDSSINVALEQGHHDQPRPLVLEVPDGKGGWKAVRTDLGFPAGKNKTMLIRLDGITGPNVVRHFRLRTNMEIYWDALRYAQGVDHRQARQHYLNAEHADLHYRGYSRMTEAGPSSPELPHYDQLVPARQPWRDLIGYYTRYGDVRELLRKVDDRYVIMNAGDEITMRFPVPPGPPAGWKRDFIWVSDGWTKDGNPNTRFSKTVLPLPYHGQKSYDRPPGRLADDPVYQRFPADWQSYHTRFVRPDVFEQGLRFAR